MQGGFKVGYLPIPAEKRDTEAVGFHYQFPVSLAKHQWQSEFGNYHLVPAEKRDTDVVSIHHTLKEHVFSLAYAVYNLLLTGRLLLWRTTREARH
jgi:hypothetical protein